ncbi:hypothetical protein [Nonomuraea sp. NPDC050310]|uniref:hypothetical protein n=1 Tax=Nonomuraea sp. NPDC050310 TaxID=3154935 RepID=UPI0033FA3F20
MAYMPASSREELRVPYEDAGATAFSVEIAILPEADGEPTDGDYKTAAWDGQQAVLTIGEGSDVVLTPGVYVVWTRITTPAHRPVRRSGLLTVGKT